MIEDILVLEEQDFNPSPVVVAVSGEGPSRNNEETQLDGDEVCQSDVVVFGCSLGSARIQQFKARVLLVAGVGVFRDCIGTDGVRKLGLINLNNFYFLHDKFLLIRSHYEIF